MKNSLYLDYMATTPLEPRVLDAMLPCLSLEGDYGNSSSNSHVFGWRAKERVENARHQVADVIGAQPDEIIWTSGATEANNLALLGGAHFNQRRGKHIITVQTEHKAVLDPCERLEKEGFEVTYLKPESTGLISLDALKNAIRKDTLLVSIMPVNNEIGVIQDIPAIAALTRENDILLHVDAAQSAGKIPLDLRKTPIDLLSISGHKVYGPKGVGALYVRRKPRVRLEPQIVGGGQEQGLRSGTLPTHQIVGLAEALTITAHSMEEETKYIKGLRDRLWQGLSILPGIAMNGHETQRIAGNLNMRIDGIMAEALMMGASDVAFSSGSACNSMVTKGSYVLKAIGLTELQALSSIRLSVGRFTTEADVDHAILSLTTQIKQLRELSPLWPLS